MRGYRRSRASIIACGFVAAACEPVIFSTDSGLHADASSPADVSSTDAKTDANEDAGADADADVADSGPTTRLVGVNISGSGSGRIYSDPAGLDCRASCNVRLPAGRVVLTVEADPGSGGGFLDAPGCARGAPACAFDLIDDVTVSVLFEDLRGELIVERVGSGMGTISSMPSGIDCGADCMERFTRGSTVTLTATAAAGSTFRGWFGGCYGLVPSCTLTMSSPRRVGAAFSDQPNEPLLLISVIATGAGEVAIDGLPDGAPATCPDVCGSVTVPGATITLTAMPRAPNLFLGWDGDCTGSKPTCVIDVDTFEKRVRAIFGQ